MLDGFARSITYLRISITDRCNYRCRYCMPDGGIEKCAHEDICSLEELRDMAAAAVRCGVKKIRVTGGEPLVRRGAVDFCRMLSEIPGVEELCVTTNGSLLKKVARPLRDAGVTHLNISLDTLNEERFRAITRLGTLQDTLDGIEAAERAGFAKIKLNCVLLGGVNDDEIADFVALTREHPWQVRFIERMPLADDGIQGCAQDDVLAALEAAYGAAQPCEKPMGFGPSTYVQFTGFLGKIGFISAVSNHFCAQCNRLRLTADGKIRPCLFSDEEIDVKAALQGSDDDVRSALYAALNVKPDAHHHREGTDRRMSQIGG